jgi:hypothetical protein
LAAAGFSAGLDALESASAGRISQCHLVFQIWELCTNCGAGNSARSWLSVRLWPPKKAAAAKIGRPTICTELPASEKVCGITLKGAPLGDSAGANLIVDQVCGKLTRAARILSGTIIGCEAK